MLFSEFIKQRRKEAKKKFYDFEDKLYTYSYVKRLGVQTPKVLWVGDVENLPPFEGYPNDIVIKANSMSNTFGVYPLRNGRCVFDGYKYTPQQIKNRIYDVPFVTSNKIPTIIEEFIRSKHDEQIPRDYKFYCDRGKIMMVHVACRKTRNGNDDIHHYLDEYFNPLEDKVVERHNFIPIAPAKPSCWDRMVTDVCKISKDLGCFMRIDMYASTRGPVFGELTPTPNGGDGYTTFGDEYLASKLLKDFDD